MSCAVGIDLGTTNSVVSVFRRGVAETLPIEGRLAFPSAVSMRDDGTMLVGQAAKARMLLDPESTVGSAKRSMGERGKEYKIGTKSLTPADVAGIVLKRLVEGAQEAIGEDVADVVITVPAYFNEAQREDTKRAGEAAGLNVLRLLPEPTAAAIAYGLDKNKDQTIVVYDLGGGTFDVSVLEVKGNTFNVRAVGGDSQLGGDDFDEAIIGLVSERFKKQSGVDLTNADGRDAKVARQRLKEAAEAAKIELSESDSAEICIPDCMGHPLEIEVSLADYNGLIDPLLQKTVACLHAVLKDAKLEPSDVDRVILVGGSTKNRAVREIVGREIKEPYVAERVDEVVSHGAAITAASLFLPEEDMAPIEITNVTAHSLGIDVMRDGGVYFRPIIARQTTYPCRCGFLGTSRPMQPRVVMTVFRGEDSKPANNTKLGELALPVTPPQIQSVPIAALFELDDDGILHFTAVQLPTGEAVQPIIEYALANDNDLDLPAVEALVVDGRAVAKEVTIESGL